MYLKSNNAVSITTMTIYFFLIVGVLNTWKYTFRYHGRRPEHRPDGMPEEQRVLHEAVADRRAADHVCADDSSDYPFRHPTGAKCIPRR